MLFLRALVAIGSTFVLLATIAMGQPQILGVFGEVGDGSTLVIVGTGFGDKPSAAPVLYDRVVDQPGYQDLASGDPIPTHVSGCVDCPWEAASQWGDGVSYTTESPRTAGGASYRATARG